MVLCLFTILRTAMRFANIELVFHHAIACLSKLRMRANPYTAPQMPTSVSNYQMLIPSFLSLLSKSSAF